MYKYIGKNSALKCGSIDRNVGATLAPGDPRVENYVVCVNSIKLFELFIELLLLIFE